MYDEIENFKSYFLLSFNFYIGSQLHQKRQTVLVNAFRDILARFLQGQ